MRAAYIISDKFDEISDAIRNELGRGITAVKTRRLQKCGKRNVDDGCPAARSNKTCGCGKEVDPHAFVIIYNVHEVLGEGFRRRI